MNEEEPEKFEDLLEPDYEGLKKFEPVLGKFRDVFYEGEQEDPECAIKPKGQRGGARKRVARPDGTTSSQGSMANRGRGRGGRAAATASKAIPQIVSEF